MLGTTKRDSNVEESIHRMLIILAITMGILVTSSDLLLTSRIHAQSAQFSYNCANHCYGLVRYKQGTSWAKGIEAYDSVRGIGPGDGHLSNEIWLIDDNNTYSNEANWVETGYHIDTVSEANGCYANTEEYFWADQRHNGGYHFHCFIGVASGDYGYDVIDNIRRDPSNATQWIVTLTPHFTSQQVALSASNIMYPNSLEIGEELVGTNSASGPTTIFHNNRYQDYNGSWIYFSGSTSWQVFSNNPPWAGWKNGEDPTKDTTGGREYACTLPGSTNPC